MRANHTSAGSVLIPRALKLLDLTAPPVDLRSYALHLGLDVFEVPRLARLTDLEQNRNIQSTRQDGAAHGAAPVEADCVTRC